MIFSKYSNCRIRVYPTVYYTTHTEHVNNSAFGFDFSCDIVLVVDKLCLEKTEAEVATGTQGIYVLWKHFSNKCRYNSSRFI